MATTFIDLSMEYMVLHLDFLTASYDVLAWIYNVPHRLRWRPPNRDTVLKGGWNLRDGD